MIPVDRFAHLTGATRAAAIALADEREREQLRRLAGLRARVDEALVERALARIKAADAIVATDATGFGPVLVTAATASSAPGAPSLDHPRNRAERRVALRRRR